MKKNRKKVICLNTKEIFDSNTEASKKYSIDSYNILKCCKGKLKSAGKINGEKAIWMFYEDYLKLLQNKNI